MNSASVSSFSGFEALAPGAFGGLTIGNAGQVEEGIGWIVEKLVSGTALNFPERPEGIDGQKHLGSLCQGGGILEAFDSFSGAFSAEFFEVELFLGSKPVFVAAFSPATNVMDGKTWVTEFSQAAHHCRVGGAVIEHGIHEVADGVGEPCHLAMPDVAQAG